MTHPADDPETRGDEGVRNDLLRLYLEDVEAGHPRDLSAYQLLFPGHEALVAEELGELASDAPAPAAGNVGFDGGRFGRFRIVRELGRGGQGAVYLAEDPRLERQVALKLLPGFSLAGEDARLRFQREARVASRLDDPGICAVHETGEVSGTPYIAMRFVEGETLAEKLARARAESRVEIEVGAGTTADIVRLFERAALSLDRAHTAGVVHRDVKPGNVMVTPDDEPVLLDFGLARAEDGSGPTLTRTGDVFGTPAYMAPEQLGAGEVDRTTDVYALGVALYECLTLARPFEAATREGLYRSILADEPRDPRDARPGLAPDLALILLTAMAREPARRYQTAADLAEDLRRLGAGQPILARAPTRAYRTRRFVTRHRALVAGTLVVVLALLLATAITSASLVEARGEREVAQETLATFEEILTSASHERDGHDVRLIDVLDRSAPRLEDALALSPEAGARLIGAVGRVYTGLGALDSAQPLLVRAYEVIRRERPPDHPDVLAARHALGVLYRRSAEYDAGAEHLAAVLAARTRSLGPDHVDTLRTALDLGQLELLRGAYGRADELIVDVRARGDETLQLDATTELAMLRKLQGRTPEAVELLEEAVRASEVARGSEHTATAAAWNNLAEVYQELDRFDEAKELFRKALAVERAKYGPRSPRTYVTSTNLAYLHKEMGDLEEAEQLYLEALTDQEAALDPEHPDVLGTVNNLARLYQAMRRFAEAERYLRRATEGGTRRLGANHPEVLTWRNNLGLVLHDLGRFEEAEDELRLALEGRETALDVNHPETLKSVNNLAYLYMDLGRDEEALACFERSLDGRRERLGEAHPDAINAVVSLGWFHQKRGRFDEANAYYEDAVATCRREGEDLREVLPLQLSLLARLRILQGRAEEARPMGREVLELWPEEHPRRGRAEALRGEIEAALD